MFYDVLRCSTMFCDVLWCFMMFYDVLWCSMMFYDVLWCSKMFYDVLRAFLVSFCLSVPPEFLRSSFSFTCGDVLSSCVQISNNFWNTFPFMICVHWRVPFWLRPCDPKLHEPGCCGDIQYKAWISPVGHFPLVLWPIDPSSHWPPHSKQNPIATKWPYLIFVIFSIPAHLRH